MERIEATWPRNTLPKARTIKVYETGDGNRLLASEDSVFAVEVADKIIPFIGARSELLDHFPSVTVDMGAVRFVCNGAKVTRPGITDLGIFKKGDIVTVRDQKHGKILAAGIALEDSESARTMTRGYVIENLHYISDRLWDVFKQI